MSRTDIDEPPVNFKTSKVPRLPVVRLWDEPTAAELLSVIVLAMSCPDPRVGMELLGEGVGVVLGRREGESPPPEPTELTPLRDADER